MVENYLSFNCTPCLLSKILVQRISHSWTWEHVLESIRVAWFCLLIFPKSSLRQTNLCENSPPNKIFCYLVEILSSTLRHPEWRDCRPHSCKFRRWSIWLTSWPSSYDVELSWWEYNLPGSAANSAFERAKTDVCILKPKPYRFRNKDTWWISAASLPKGVPICASSSFTIGCQSSIVSNIFQSRPMVNLWYFEESKWWGQQPVSSKAHDHVGGKFATNWLTPRRCIP